MCLFVNVCVSCMGVYVCIFTSYHTDITAAQRSKSVHAGLTADDDSGDDHKPKFSRKSSDTTSLTLLSDDEKGEVVKVVKHEFQVCKYNMYIYEYLVYVCVHMCVRVCIKCVGMYVHTHINND